MRIRFASLLTLFALAACGGGAPKPSSCQLGNIGMGPDPDTGTIIHRYSVECDTATYRAVCEALDASMSRWKVSCAYGTFDHLLTASGGVITSTFESDTCPLDLEPFNEACGYETLPRDPNWGK